MAQINVDVLWVVNVFSHRMILFIYEAFLSVHRLVIELLNGLVLLEVPDISNIVIVFEVVS